MSRAKKQEWYRRWLATFSPASCILKRTV